MTAPAFTPGPWIVDDGDVGLWGVFQDDDRDAICYLVEPGTCQTEPLRPDQSAANARLIAAAPELYGAVDYAFAMLSTDRLHGDEIDHFFGLAKAALAKARGEQ